MHKGVSARACVIRAYVCVCVLIRDGKKGFYYVLVGRLGIITQAWLSTYNVV